MKVVGFLLLALLGQLNFVTVLSNIAPPTGDDNDNDDNDAFTKQCTGYDIDFDRLQSLSTNDLSMLLGTDDTNEEESQQQHHVYGRSKVNPITAAAGGGSGDGGNTTAREQEEECIGTRHRLQENVDGVPIYGADIIVTMDTCFTEDVEFIIMDETLVDGRRRRRDYDTNFLATLANEPGASIESLSGKTFTTLNLKNGDGSTIPTYTPQEAAVAIAQHLGFPEIRIFGEDLPTLEIFISTGGDYLAYRSYVMVETKNLNDNQGALSASSSSTTSDLIEIAVDAHDLSVLSKCTIAGSTLSNNYRRKRRLRSRGSSRSSSSSSSSSSKPRDLQVDRGTSFNCQSCATPEPVTWSREKSNCNINSLYLENNNAADPTTTICTVGVPEDVDINGTTTTVLGPGPVDELFWRGTLDCQGGTRCSPMILPSCRDALSDIQYGGLATMRFLQDYLGIYGGLNEDKNQPVAVKAYAHYLDHYCNAFYHPASDAVYFGDCDCDVWGPLVSLDIVGHEIFHGVTRHSSNLVYTGQPGGLNEAYSDIFGTTLEFYVNDPMDPPDFTIAEQVGGALRDMEFPLHKSISSVCDFVPGLNVHYSSGPLNKAYVNSVRLCADSECGGDLRACAILMGTVFSYSNIHGLTRTSNFLDGAQASCSLIEEFFIVREQPAAAATTTVCTPSQVKQFIIEGWASVDVTISESDCTATMNCPTPAPSTSAPTNPPPSQMPTPPPTVTPTANSPPPTTNDAEESTGGNDTLKKCLALLRSATARMFYWV